MKRIELLFWGVIAALGALFAEMLISLSVAIYRDPTGMLTPSYSDTALPMIVIFVLVEEAFKYLLIAKKVEPISLERSFITNSLLIGAGFALAEISLIAWQDGALLQSPYDLAKIAAVHMATAGIMGYLVALKTPAKISTFFSCLLAAAVPHLAYNLLALNLEGLIYGEQLVAALLFALVVLNIWNTLRLPQKLAS